MPVGQVLFIAGARISRPSNLPDFRKLVLLYTTDGKIYLCRAVSGREPSYSFSDIDVRVTQQNNLAALL